MLKICSLKSQQFLRLPARSRSPALLKISIIGKIAIKLFSIVDLATVQKGKDEPIVSTMERYSDFAERLLNADVGVTQMRRLHKMLMENEIENFDKLPSWLH
jgi:endonuclease V-like protein UPF0215 family